jgi:hypothetical protein
MHFVSVHTVLLSLVKVQPVPVYLHKQAFPLGSSGVTIEDVTEAIERAKWSEAADVLHAELHNARFSKRDRPSWYEVKSETSKPSTGGALEDEGMDLLWHVANWADRFRKNKIRHLSECFDAGLDPSATAYSFFSPDGGKYKFQHWQRKDVLGFDRAKLNSFLSAAGIRHGRFIPDAIPEQTK